MGKTQWAPTMFADRLPVTDKGVLVPKALFGDAAEVALRQENGRVSLEPVPTTGKPDPHLAGPVPPDDPLWRLCDVAVDIDVTDASTKLDKYLYDFDE
jgi:hypothetical protein